MEKVNILWTGGLDSTFRVCELSRLNVEIQPYYVLSVERNSSDYEIAAIHKITNALKAKDSTIAKINDLIIVDEYMLLSDPEVNAGMAYLTQKYSLGSQYKFLAVFTRQYGIKLEVGIEGNSRSKARNTILGECQLERQEISKIAPLNSQASEYYIINSETSAPEAMTVLGNFHYPAHLFNIEKAEEVALMKQWGLGDIVPMTWFCHTPVLGLPCGRCNPCKDAINEGMGWRVPITGRVLGIARGIVRRTLRILHV